MANCYNTLLWANPEGSAEPIRNVLATDYSTSDDGLIWTFELRQGVKFHDGTIFDASVAKWSLDRYIEVNTGAAFIYWAVDTIEILDDYTIRINLTSPDPLDWILTSAYSAWMMSPNSPEAGVDRTEWYNEGHDSGTGPYYIESYEPNTKVVLKKFDDYWEGWEGSHFDTIVFEIIPEELIQQQMLESGAADIVGGVPYENIATLEARDDITAITAPSFMNLFGLMNTQKAPLDNPKVRQAISYAIPYQDIVDSIMLGYATQARGPIPKGMWGHLPDIHQYNLNLQKARDLLTEAGYPDGLDRVLNWPISPGNTVFELVGELCKTSLAKIGVEINVNPNPTRFELARSPDPNDAQDVYLFWWWPTYVTPYDYLFSMFHSFDSPVYNFCYLNDPEIDDWIDEGAMYQATDRDKAIELFGQAQEKLVEEAVAIFFFDQAQPRLYRSDFMGYIDNPAYTNVVLFYTCWREEFVASSCIHIERRYRTGWTKNR